MRTHLVVCLDGVGPEYLAATPMPTLAALGRRGWQTTGQGAMPSVTNVNNVSIVTGGPPALHGLTANFYRDRQTGQEVYMESAAFVLAPTMFEKAARAGRRSALITAKDKLRTLLARGADEVISAESPPAWLVERIGPPPPILSVEVNHWLLRAATALCQTRPPDLLYVTMTDFAQHKYAPESDVSHANLTTVDARLAGLLDSGPEFAAVITADHGMRAKTRGLDLGPLLRAQGIAADAVPIIKDRYVAHHQNLGGAAYVFLDRLEQEAEAIACLQAEEGVESVWPRAEAARRFLLHPERIGDLFVLATEETVFGALPEPRMAVALRSHGCLHTTAVPIIAAGPGVPTTPFRHNYDAATWIVWD